MTPIIAVMALTTVQLQTINLAINAVPLRTTAIRWADEGRDGYDCKGMVWLKAQRAHEAGIPWEHMRVLIVREVMPGRPESHAVLAVDGYVLDNLSPWLEKPSDYDVVISQPVDLFVAGYILNPERR